jgi:hypothetical protein
MPVSVTCPYCRSTFALAEVPPARRTPCPTCGESVPVSADAPTATTAVAPPPAPPARPSTLVFVSLGLTALIVAGFLVWFFFLQPKPPQTQPTTPAAPPATLPPRAVPGLKYIPKDSQVVAAIQPAALWQYADRTGQNPDALLEQMGVPKELLRQFRDAGVPPEAIQSVVLAANVEEFRAVLVLTLREPPPDEKRFREKAKLEVFGLTPAMAKANDKTYLFALLEKDLALAKAPSGGYDALRAGLRESIDRVSPAAFAWAATDAKDWANLPILKSPVAASMVSAEVVKKLGGVRAAAVGVSLEPDLVLGVAVRTNDSTVAREQAEAMKAKLAEVKGVTAAASGEWAEATIPLDPPAETLPQVTAALKK